MAEYTLKQFEDLNLYSNDSMQKVIASIVNESSNAVLVNMFEDSLVLLDHDEGTFYFADYSFNPKNLQLKIENFEEISLVHEESNFKDKVTQYFEEEDSSSISLAEAYKEDVMDQERYIRDLINESISTKDFSQIIDWNEVKNAIDEESIEDLRGEEFFKLYEGRLTSHPLTEVKLFDWENPVVVSLVETERVGIVNKTAVEKANDLWKRTEFKESFKEVAETLIEDVEEGTELMRGLMEDFPQIFYLDNADRKTLFGKTILSVKDLTENMDILIQGLDLLFEKFDLAEMREEYLSEAKDAEKEDEEGMEGEEKDEKEKAPEVEKMDMGKVASELKSIAVKIEDEDIKKKLEDLIEKVEKGLEEGTRPDVMKEAISILTL